MDCSSTDQPKWDLEQWLEYHNIEEFKSKFIEAGYTSRTVCSQLDDEDLDILGIKLPGHRKTIKLAAQELNKRINSSNHKKAKVDGTKKSFKDNLRISDFWARAKPRTLSESCTNGIRIFLELADHATPLSEKGIQQARSAGEAIDSYFEQQYGSDPPEGFRCKMWMSPYKRTRQTANQVREASKKWITDVQENIFLAEQQFGLFEGFDWSSTELDTLFPKEIVYYRKASEFGGRFWAKVPLGESRFDVCLRTYQMFGHIHREAREGITNLIIVTHGMTMRAFLMMWLQHNPEWLEVEPNPKNGAVRLIDCNQDKGYIWGETEKPRTEGPELLLSASTAVKQDETPANNNSTDTQNKTQQN